ncbi:MAG TPA: Na+/H+ antiporter [Solirubrobacteraceae bacterium]|nr:Na+/H+ antiporter [Solirubrobacteraceae bacterium]
MATVELLIGLLAAIALLGVVAERASLPYPAVLVLGGIVLGLIPGLPAVRLDPELVLFGLIPPLVYAAAFRAASYDLRLYAVQIVSLATGLVLLTVLAGGTVGHLVGGIPWASAFVFGALVAPTDPVSASAVMGEVGAPERIVAILEGESLINDGTGLAVFQVAVAAAVSGGFSVGHGALKLLEISAGGIAVGLAIGWVLVRIRRPLDAPSIEIVLGLVAAFGSYSAADAAGFSGVLAAVAAGLYTGRHAQDISTPQSRLQMEPVWDAVTFVLESVLFLLIGLELHHIVNGIPHAHLTRAAMTGAVAIVVMIALRAGWMLGISPLLSRLLPAGSAAPSRRERVVLAWSGMRGALSLAGALSIPLAARSSPFPARDEDIFLVYCVVLGTLIVPSFTLETLVRRLGLGQSERLREQEIGARIRVAHAALAQLEDIAEQHDLPEELLARLRGVYELRLSRLESGRPGATRDGARDALLAIHEIRHQLVAAQRRALDELRRERAAPAEALAHIQHDIDLEEARLGG